MGTPTKRAVAIAGRVAESALEDIQANSGRWSPEDAAAAATQTRQDVAGIWGMEAAVHEQLVNISRAVWLIAALVVFAVARPYF